LWEVQPSSLVLHDLGKPLWTMGSH
jgi:hypothetical protein